MLTHVCQRREEFARLSMDRQGELLHKLGEVFAELTNETGLNPLFGLHDDAVGFECPDCGLGHGVGTELMRMTMDYLSDREGCFDVVLDCPMCGAQFGGGVCRTEEGGGKLL